MTNSEISNNPEKESISNKTIKDEENSDVRKKNTTTNKKVSQGNKKINKSYINLSK